VWHGIEQVCVKLHSQYLIRRTCSWFRNGDHWNIQRNLLKNTTHALSKHSNSVFTTQLMKAPPTRLLYYMTFNWFQVPSRVNDHDTSFCFSIFRTLNTDLVVSLLDVFTHRWIHCKIISSNFKCKTQGKYIHVCFNRERVTCPIHECVWLSYVALKHGNCIFSREWDYLVLII